MADTMGLREFNLKIDEFVADAPNKLLELKQRLALEALRRLVFMTPVGNPALWEVNKNRPAGSKERKPAGYAGGRARANWQVTEGTPASGFTEAIDEDGNATIADGSGKILGVVNPYGVIWISNNLPYIEELEKGHSTQAPAGMLAVTVADIQSVLK